MNIFNKLFGKKQIKPNSDIWPSRQMNFKFELKPHNGSNLAAQFKESILKIDGTDIDYSVESIKFVDNFLQKFRDKKIKINDFAETVFIAGCYVGQVMVYHAQGEWIGEESIPGSSRDVLFPLVIKFPNGNIANPIAKAFKKYHYGESDNLEYFYYVATNPPKS